MKKHIPNTITCLNLISGCIATYWAFCGVWHIALLFIVIGAVFDFFAGTLERAPLAWQQAGYEWLYRLLKEPKRMWRRYIIGNTEFLYLMFREWAKF